MSMDDLHGGDAQMHMTEAEQQMHVHYMHDQNQGMHHMSNGNGIDDEHDDGTAGAGEGIDEELHNDPGNISDNHGAMMVPSADNNQLTLSFQGQVYVFDSVSPEKVTLLSSSSLFVIGYGACFSVSCIKDCWLELLTYCCIFDVQKHSLYYVYVQKLLS